MKKDQIDFEDQANMKILVKPIRFFSKYQTEEC